MSDNLFALEYELKLEVLELKEELKERLDVTYRRFDVNKRLKRETVKLKKELNIIELQLMLIKSVEEKMNNLDISSNNYINKSYKTPSQASHLPTPIDSISYFAEIYYQINNVSRNKNSRDISFFLSVDSQVVKLDYLIAEILDMKMSKNWRGGIKVKGGGMDMGFKVINDLQNTIDIKLRHRQI